MYVNLISSLHYSLISKIAPDSLSPYHARFPLFSQCACTYILRPLQHMLEHIARHIKENCYLYTTISQTLSRLYTGRRIWMLGSVKFMHSNAEGSMPWTAHAQPDQPPGSFLTGSVSGLTSWMGSAFGCVAALSAGAGAAAG